MNVAFSDCEGEPLGKQVFLRALALELGRGPLHESSSDSAAIVVNYRCDGVAVVQIRGAQTKQRELRTDDVALKERARALALSVAEFARAGDEVPEKTDSAHEGATKEAPEPPKAAEKPPEVPKQVEPEKPHVSPPPAKSPLMRDEGAKGPAVPAELQRERAVVYLRGSLRYNTDVEELYYGAALGLDLRRFDLQLEGMSGHATTARGSVASGLLALRLGRALPVTRIGTVETGVVASVAAGLNWALGSSDVVGTRVRRVLMPYADARAGLWVTSAAHVPFTPLFELYGGRGAGIVANVDGASTLATGGWFTGIDLGLWL